MLFFHAFAKLFRMSTVKCQCEGVHRILVEVRWDCCRSQVGLLWKSCGIVVEVRWDCCGSQVILLWKSGGILVEVMWFVVEVMWFVVDVM